MSRLSIPASIAEAPEASRPMLEAVRKQVGAVPTLYRLLSTSPAALEGLLGLSGAMAKGTLDAATRERIAIAVAEINGCDYCLSAHSFIGKRQAGLDDIEIAANRDARSADPKAYAALRLAATVAERRGHVAQADLDAARAAGFDDEGILEIVLHVALNTLTNYVNVVADTEIDFPPVSARRAA